MIEKGSKLLKAVLKRSVLQVQDSLVDGEDPRDKDNHGRSYLDLSVFLRCDDLVNYFLSEGLDVNQGDQDNVTALHRACRIGSESIVDILLSWTPYASAKAKGSITPLHIAAAYGHTKCINKLLQYSDDVGGYSIKTDRDDNNHTALHYAAAEGHVAAASALINNGLEVNVENAAGNRPLHFAAVSGNPEMCHLLIRSSADIDAQNFNGQTALHFATQQPCVNTVAELLKNNADPNIKDMDGNTCSHLALKNGHIELVKLFMMDLRTDSSISDNEENTVLHVALKLGHFNLIPMMLPRARDLTRQNASGCSVIIEAIKNQLEDLALEMLEACPSLVHTATHDLVTPLHLAAERGMTYLTKQLLIAGAQVDAADASGLTPSLYCAKNDSVLECLAMIEDIMMITDNNMDMNNQQQQNHVKGDKSKISSRISS